MEKPILMKSKRITKLTEHDVHHGTSKVVKGQKSPSRSRSGSRGGSPPRAGPSRVRSPSPGRAPSHSTLRRPRTAGRPPVVGRLPAVNYQLVADLRRVDDRPLPEARGRIRLLVVGHPRRTGSTEGNRCSLPLRMMQSQVPQGSPLHVGFGQGIILVVFNPLTWR